mgnify:CR=1 FL=1
MTIWKILLGLTKDDFDHMVSYLRNVRNTSTRSKRTAMAVFWLKMRSANLSFAKIASMLNIKGGHRVASKVFHAVCKDLERFIYTKFLLAALFNHTIKTKNIIHYKIKIT